MRAKVPPVSVGLTKQAQDGRPDDGGTTSTPADAPQAPHRIRTHARREERSQRLPLYRAIDARISSTVVPVIVPGRFAFTIA